MIAEGTMVRVEWTDITDTSSFDWNDDGCEPDTETVVSLAWVARDYTGGRTLHVAKDWCVSDGRYRSVLSLPVGCVLLVTDVQTGEELWDRGRDD